MNPQPSLNTGSASADVASADVASADVASAEATALAATDGSAVTSGDAGTPAGFRTSWRRQPGMLAGYLMATALAFVWAMTGKRTTSPTAADDEADREAGLTTLEIAVIALGLFVIAGALVAAVTAAVNSRTAQIN
ncbi:hypothetical protein [Kineococcus sp. SYSU DK003]|uniref:hypothetical protein n=1 Tax=Kineococcus sp. SYSU DK003 TaxID=3383124 RepID=UPI003D7D442A